jgi:hypothetical protein
MCMDISHVSTTILNKNVIFFHLQNHRIGVQNRSCLWVLVGGVGRGESVWEGEYIANTVYTCM